MRIFLSFNSKDRELAQAIYAGLKRLDAAADIFLDEVSLGSGFWLPKIFGRIADADSFLFLIGPHGIGPWQEIEYFSAFQRHVDEHGKMPLVPVIIDNAEAPGLAGLRSLNWVIAPHLEDDNTLWRMLTALKGAAIDAASTPLWQLVNPYRGLEAMTEANADYFYGRSAESSSVLTSLAEKPSRLPVLVGPSGAGKTSIALAGVLSSLKSMRWPQADTGAVGHDWPSALHKSRGWAYLTVRPGDTPIRSLVSAFARLWSLDLTDPEQAARPRSWIDRLQDGKNSLSELIDATQEQVRKREGEAPEAILIYLDQVEELYTLSNRSEAACFSRVMSEGLKDPRLRAFATLRADDLDFFRADGALFGCAEFTRVNPLTRDQLHLVVTKPPELLKVSFEDEFLARRLTEAAEKEPGALPLLSDQLNSMWASMVKRGDATLRLPSQAIDVGGVLTSRAESFIDKHPGCKTDLKRLLTLKLTSVHADGEPVSRQATRDECSDAEWALASSLADSQWRLVVTGTRDADGKVVAEIAHDALLRAWPRLAGWLAEERDFLIFKGEVERKDREWREGGKPDAGLLVGRDLARLDQLGMSQLGDLPKDAVEFVHASRVHEKQRQEEQIRLQRRLLIGQAALLLVALLSAGLFIFWREAREQLHNVQRDQSFRLAKLAEQRSDDAGSAVLLALEALPDSSSQNDRPFVAEAELQLDRALRNMHESLILPTGDNAVAAAFSSDGGKVITVSPLTVIRTWDSVSGKMLGEPVPVEKDAGLQNATFSPDSKRLAMVLEDGHVLVRNLDSNETAKIAASSPREAAFSSDGQRLAIVSGDGMAQIYDLAHPDSPIKSIRCSRDTGIELVQFNPQGTRIAVASHDGPAAIFDIDTGQQVGQPLAQAQGISSIAYNAEGTRLLVTALDGSIRVWDAETGAQLNNSFEPQEDLKVARFSPDGKRVAAGSANGVIRIWDADSGALLQAFSANSDSPIAFVAFSPDGSRIVSATDDRTARVWIVEKPNPMLVDRPIRHGALVRDARFSRSGNQVVTASEDGTAIVWDLQKHAAKPFRSQDGKLTVAAFDPTGTYIVAGSAKGTLQIWDVNATARQSINAHSGEIWALAFSPDGKQLLTASEDGTAKLWDFNTRQLVRAMSPARRDAVRSAAFSPDGNLIATGYLGKTTQLWDAKTGKPVTRPKDFGTHTGTVRSVTFSPDGRLIMTASADGSIKFWNAATGAIVPSLSVGSEGGHLGAFRSALFSPNGAHIVTASAQGGVQVWDPKSGNLIRELIAGDSEIWKASFSPDGERIVVASADHTATIWRAPTVQRLVDQAKATVPRCLTPDERSSLFLPEEPPEWCRDKWPYNTPELKLAPQPPRLESMFRRWFGARDGGN